MNRTETYLALGRSAFRRGASALRHAAPLLLLACQRHPQNLITQTEDTDGPAELDSAAPWTGSAPLRINELMAKNHATIRSPTGAWSDWVELYNPLDHAVSLEGWTITDDAAAASGEPAQGLGPLEIGAGGFLLLWADGEPEAGAEHLPFQLSAEGDGLTLTDPDGQSIDSLRFGELLEDVSLGRPLDGGDGWALQLPATPGASNGGPGTPVELSTERPSAGPACGLLSDLSSDPRLEGDRLTFSVRCGGPLSTEQALIEPIQLPVGATFDAATLTLDWLTGPADAAQHRFIFAVTPADGSARVPTAEAITVQVVDDPFRADSAPVDPLTYREEWGLPVVHVTWATAPGRAAASEATLTFDGRPYAAEVRVHGKTSTNYPKVSYVLELTDEELQVDDWGGTVNHLLLITTFDDNSYVRQKFTYDLWNAMSEAWGLNRLGPRSWFTVVYINGEYHGLYVVVERPDDEHLRHRDFDGDANLYKAIDADANFALTDALGEPKTTLHQGYEKREGTPEDDFTDLEAWVSFVGSSPADTIIREADDWFELDEFIDWYLLVHYTVAEDSKSKNCYLYHDPETGRFRYSPWDFNGSWGQNWRTYRSSPEFSDDYADDNRIFWAIHAVPEAEAELWSRYHTLRADGPFSLDWQRSTLDEYFAKIDRSAQRDWDWWGAQHLAYDGWASARTEKDNWTDYEGEKAYLYQWIEDREAWMTATHP